MGFTRLKMAKMKKCVFSLAFVCTAGFAFCKKSKLILLAFCLIVGFKTANSQPDYQNENIKTNINETDDCTKQDCDIAFYIDNKEAGFFRPSTKQLIYIFKYKEGRLKGKNKVLTIKNNGDVINDEGEKLAEIITNGVRNCSYDGYLQLESDGIVLMDGEVIGRIDDEGAVYIDNYRYGTAKGLDKRYAALVYFSAFFDRKLLKNVRIEIAKLINKQVEKESAYNLQWSSDRNCEVFDVRNCYLIFEKCKYQYYMDKGKIVKHGEIECTNGNYQFVWDDEWRRNNVCVKGSYNKGKKDGQWHYSEEYFQKGKQYISEVTAIFRDGKLNGEYRYSKKEDGKTIIIVICSFIGGKPFGKYYQMRDQTETIIYYDEYGTKTGPMTIITKDEEHHGTFKHDYLYDYYYIDKKTKEKFTPAGMQGQNKTVKLLQFTDNSGDNAGIVLCGIIGTSTIID